MRTRTNISKCTRRTLQLGMIHLVWLISIPSAFCQPVYYVQGALPTNQGQSISLTNGLIGPNGSAILDLDVSGNTPKKGLSQVRTCSSRVK